MTRLLDIGLERITNLIMDMGHLSEQLVNSALESYEKGTMLRSQIFEGSEKLRFLQIEVTDFATELIARYQPVARDLRLIQSFMDAAYGFSRFGRYAYDIAEVLDTIGPLPNCDKSQVSSMAKTAKEMIQLSVKSLEKLDKDASVKLYMLDDSVDSMFRNYLKKAITQTKKRNFEPRCYVSALLILRYLERISDHACYIGDCVHYIVTGDPSPRR
ncbi:MAG: phosphate uptake regulator PhoU [Thaumarchaeota archaeon]|nr:MAG: phosphate uptake regulator PhoU [Nitrososphaerota archaeon]